MQVRHILHGKGRDVVAISAGATLTEAAKLPPPDRKIGALIVKDKNGSLSGIISERDLVHAIARQRWCGTVGTSFHAHDARRRKPAWRTTTVESVMEMMTRGRFRHVPVLDDQFMLYSGMISSIGDVVKTRIAETVS